MSAFKFPYPVDGPHRPTLEPEVVRAILASWAAGPRSRETDVRAGQRSHQSRQLSTGSTP